eukprot:3471429-Amphidinium_carterae.1
MTSIRITGDGADAAYNAILRRQHKLHRSRKIEEARSVLRPSTPYAAYAQESGPGTSAPCKVEVNQTLKR